MRRMFVALMSAILLVFTFTPATALALSNGMGGAVSIHLEDGCVAGEYECVVNEPGHAAVVAIPVDGFDGTIPTEFLATALEGVCENMLGDISPFADFCCVPGAGKTLVYWLYMCLAPTDGICTAMKQPLYECNNCKARTLGNLTANGYHKMYSVSYCAYLYN